MLGIGSQESEFRTPDSEIVIGLKWNPTESCVLTPEFPLNSPSPTDTSVDRLSSARARCVPLLSRQVH